ncbi:MAG: hypothetical protein U0X20_20760 [Caldilineaceae bacterium]
MSDPTSEFIFSASETHAPPGPGVHTHLDARLESQAGRLALLRRYEPIMKFTRGEQFFPMDAETYIRCCSLWIKRPKEEPRQLIPAGQLTPDLLAELYQDEFGTVRYLQFTEPLKATEMAAMALRRTQARRKGDAKAGEDHVAAGGKGFDAGVFNAGTGRLARVGYTSRIIDALFSVSLLARGRVPGDLATAAAEGYHMLLAADDRHIYHGRVVEEGGWIVLQYWFFYLYNNWRSGFNGANDHEADWEMVCIYLAHDAGGHLQPEWVAFASHDYAGDDLRRRWDDPEIQKVGHHPVIFSGAGSHSSYFSAGEYLTELELKFLAPVSRLVDFVVGRWRAIQGPSDPDELPRPNDQYPASYAAHYGSAPSTPGAQASPALAPDAPAVSGAGSAQDPGFDPSSVLAIPFVDYARGDGFALGPGQVDAWSTPCLIDENTGWVRAYRGLWGLYTQDPFAGEDAPAGPMYNRDGSVRRAWFDPVGWAGLDKVSPRAALPATVEAQKAALRTRQLQLRDEVQEQQSFLRGLDVQAAAMRNQPHLQRSYLGTMARIEAVSRAVAQRQDEIAANDALLESLDRYAANIAGGLLGDPRAHIRRAHTPAARSDLPAGRVAELWAAISVTVLLVAFIVLFLVKPGVLPFWMATIVALFAFVEAGLRGTFTRVVGSFAVGLGVIAGLVLVYEFFWWVIGAIVLALALYILYDNLRELTRRSGTSGGSSTPPSASA